MRNTIGLVMISLLIFPGGWCHGQSTVVSARVEHPPVVDGDATDLAWARAEEWVTHDPIADVDISLKSVHTDQTVFFLVRFPDADESRLHKPWVWNPAQQIYENGPQREDVLVLKWAMEHQTTDLSIFADKPYSADVWFWKAHRTDPAGFADDKIQRLSATQLLNSKPIQSKGGKALFLQRKGDQGRSAYQSTIHIDYQGDQIPQFTPREPTGSRADIKARGQWQHGTWHLELSRSLVTGHPDDIQFDISRQYRFGISRYEVAGRAPNAALSQPLYGSGDVSERIVLQFVAEH